MNESIQILDLYRIDPPYDTVVIISKEGESGHERVVKMVSLIKAFACISLTILLSFSWKVSVGNSDYDGDGDGVGLDKCAKCKMAFIVHRNNKFFVISYIFKN